MALLAMHMANELLSIPVAVATCVVAAVAVAVASARSRRSLDAERLPLMGVMGAFVFAAQMINFTLPGMGTSGHLGGGVLLAILLGPWAAIVTMTAILIIQCLLFQDGGLLALGCNIINMGVVPCLLGWAVYRLVLGPVATAGAARQYLAAWVACLLAVTAGAVLVPVEAAASGILRIPLLDFTLVIAAVHLFIGFFEGLITFAVIAYLRRTRPAVLGLESAASLQRMSRRALAASMVVTSALLAGVVSGFASAHPDGLEWVSGDYSNQKYHRAAVENESATIAAVTDWQMRWSLSPEYSRREAALGEQPAAKPESTADSAAGPDASVNGWTSLAGLGGTALTLAVVIVAAWLLRRRKSLASSVVCETRGNCPAN